MILPLLILSAILGWNSGNVAGFTTTRDAVAKAMCSYYPDWDFCKQFRKIVRSKDLAIRGLSEKVRKLEETVYGEQRRSFMCVKAFRLNVRLYPLDGKVIDIYKKGKRVEIIDRIGGWARTRDGWVSEKYLGRCRDEKTVVSSGNSSLGNNRSGAVADLPENGQKPHAGNRPVQSDRVVSDEVLR